MRDSELRMELDRRLRRQGTTEAVRERFISEISGHLEESAEELEKQGCSQAEAWRQAWERLGDLERLARDCIESERRGWWCERHRVVCFGLLPPLAILAWCLFCTVVAVGLDRWWNWTGTLLPGLPPNVRTIQFVANAVYGSGVFLVPALFVFLAMRRACGLVGVVLPVTSCLLHGALQQTQITDHSISWGYGSPTLGWLDVIGPVAGSALVWWHCAVRSGVEVRPPGVTRVRQWPLLIALLAVLTGCKSGETVRQRAWMGGEFRAVEAPGIWGTRDAIPAFPQDIETPPRAGLLVTRVEERSPVATGGIREGDVVILVDGHRVTTPDELLERVRVHSPGTTIPIGIYREHQPMDRQVLLGRELYQLWHRLVLGPAVSGRLDLIPNPGFSVLLAGYQREASGVELSSPVGQYLSEQRSKEDGPGVESREGWEAWMVLFRWGGRVRVLSQEPVEGWRSGL